MRLHFQREVRKAVHLFRALADILLFSDKGYPFQLGRFRSGLPDRLESFYKHVIIPCSAINP